MNRPALLVAVILILLLVIVVSARKKTPISSLLVEPAGLPSTNSENSDVPLSNQQFVAYEAGDHNESIKTLDGRTRAYLLHIPPGYNPQRAYPLVLSFHGTGGTGKGQGTLSHMSAIADREEFITVYPNGVDREWADGSGAAKPDKDGVDDVAFVSSLIDHLASRLHIDTARVFATGISNGGIFAHRLGCELSEKIAAIAPVAQNIASAVAVRCQLAKPVSVIFFRGTEDPYVPYGGGITSKGSDIFSSEATATFWAEKNGCDRAPAIEELPDIADDGTSVTRQAYRNSRDGVEVVLYTINGGGHTWPGGLQYLPARLIGKTTKDIDASELMWEFFKAHPSQMP